MSSKADVVVIGAGVIGLSTAYLLAQRGVQVCVLDRLEPGKEASWAGAGIVPPGNLAHTVHPMDQLRAKSSHLIKRWAKELEEQTGQPVGYRPCGGLEIFDKSPVELLDLWSKEQITFEQIDPKRLRDFSTELQAHPVMYYFPDTAQIRNPWYMRSLREATRKLGVEIQAHQEVVAFETDGSKLRGVSTLNGSRFLADRFLISPGAWGGRLLKQLNVSLPVAPVRGQILLYQTDPKLLSSIVSVGKNYFVPRGDGKLLVGATEDPDAGFEKKIKATDQQALHQFACEQIPSLRTTPIETSWAGLRPGSPNGIPFIGPVPGLLNTYYAGGHFRAGIQLSTGTALAMAELLTDRTPWLDLSPFRLDRTSSEPFIRPFQS